MTDQILYEKELPGSDYSRPLDDPRDGYEVTMRLSLAELNQYIHIQMSPVCDSVAGMYMAVLKLSEARQLHRTLGDAIARLQGLGER